MDLGQIEKEAENSISLVKNTSDLEKWRIKYLGRKSTLSLFFNSLSKLSLVEKKKQGQKANTIRQFLSSLYKGKKVDIGSDVSFSSDFIDITQPGEKMRQGHLHPLTLILRDITNSFQKMGFSIIEGPEIETEYYNFDALNIPAGHPAREMWDTLWIKPEHKNQKSKMLLRTHTSPMQVRFMETYQPPFRLIVPGKCFRYEATDASHEIQFHQIEGLMVGENISLSNFKAIIEEVVKGIFKQKVLVRFRPSYFPFVSPGVEVDIKMKSKIKGQKSKVKDEWLEIMGAGMVHPDLFKRAGYANNRWQGFAFGLGVERIAMIKYHIDDIRLFFSPDVRFLEQF
jgi:phenylalanyl-tRNA synthetase alpha chain